MKINILIVIYLCIAFKLAGQQPILVGAGSYAEYTPLYKCKTADHAGDQSRLMETRTLYITDASKNLPVPTNDWWTDLIISQYSGNLWSHPQVVNAEEYGFFVAYPKEWTADGREMKWNTQLEVLGKKFHPISAADNRWHDWGLDFLMKDNEKEILVTMAHGVPFTWVESKNVEVQLRAKNAVLYNESGAVQLPFTGSQLVIQMGNDAYGIYAPAGTIFTQNADLIDVTFSGAEQYLSISMLPTKDDLQAFAQYAYVLPRKTEVSWEYNETLGKITSHWNLTTDNLQGGTQKNVLQGFLPHQYKRSDLDFGFTAYEYATPRGKMKMAAGNSFSITYDFNGMLPFFGAPKEDTNLKNPYQKERMKQLISEYADKGGFGTDTYWGGKGLTQMALYMSFAHEMGETALFEKCKSRLKTALVDWLTYTPGENTFFFARYNRWGGLVGYDTSYDSDTFNDHHFHYGYFTYAASLLSLFDNDFKTKYGEMATLLAKDYANWDRIDTKFPFLRNLDPWEGHSYAGGLAGAGGNGQESTSEAMQSWGGMYLLGVATNNKAMRDAGIFGWVTESRGTAEYWFDRDRENIDYTKYDKPYSSNLTSQGVGWWTWFSGDPVWMHSIQWMPISPCLKYLYENIEFAKWDYTQMWNAKEVGSWSTNPSVASSLSKESGLGNVVLSYLQIFNPDSAASVFDTAWNAQMPIAKNPDTGGISYFVTQSHRTYGEICWDIHADVPTATTYKHPQTGKYTYMVYNPDATERTVHFYQNGLPILQMKAPAGRLTVYSDEPTMQKIEIINPLSSLVEPSKTLQLNAQLLDQYGASIEGPITWSINQGGTISTNGLFTASATKGTATITAQSGTLSTSITLKIDEKQMLQSAQILPKQAYLEIGKTLNYSLEMLDQYGLPYQAKVDWQILKNGEIVKTDSIFNLQIIGKYTIKASVEGKSYTADLYLSPIFSNIALNKTATVSSVENVGTPATYATDGSLSTRWGSAHADPQWIAVDLQTACYVAYVTLVWEAAYASLYNIQVSDNGTTWTTVQTVNGLGGTERIEVNKTTRYVRMYGQQRGSAYGYSLFEFEIQGVPPTSATPTLFGIDMTPHSGSLKENESVQLQVVGYDQFGNTMSVAPVFSILSGIGTITPKGLFTPTKYGNASVQAKVNAQISKASFLVEESIKLSSVVISPKKAALIIGKSQAFSCVAKDQFGAPFATESLFYSLIGSNGNLNGSTFSGTSVGSSKVIVGSANPSPKDTALIDVSELTATNLALLKPVMASSYENAGTLPAYVNDGDKTTRWGSTFNDPEYIQVDLQENFVLSAIKLFWQSAYATSYRVDVSVDEDNWTTVYADTNANGGDDIIALSPVAARFVRVWSLKRNSAYGASLSEMEVYGTSFWTNAQATTVQVSPQPLVAYLGQDLQLSVSLFDQYGLHFAATSNFIWSIDGGATIDANGKLTPLATGYYTLTVQNGDLSQQFQIRIMATKTLTRLEITPSFSTIEINENLQLSAKGFDQFGNEMTNTPLWSTSGGSISINGLFSSSVIGNYNITANVGSVSSTVQVQVIAANATNLALNKPATSSSGTASASVDGNGGTRWESAFQDGPEWLQVDLGDAYQLTDVEIVWEGASAKDYQIQISRDGSSWSTIKTVTAMLGARTDTWRIAGLGRYVRIWCTQRATVYGYSIFELRLYGTLMQVGQPYSIELVNPTSKMEVGDTIQYSAVVKDKSGIIITNPLLSWSVSGLGNMSNSGLFLPYFEGNAVLSVSSQLSTTSLAIVISPSGATGFSDVDFKNQQISVYPNPFSNRINVKLEKNEGYKKLQLHSITGNLIIEKDITDMPIISLNTHQITPGYYVLSLISDQKILSRKLIK